MNNYNPEVTEYISKQQDFAKEILTHLREVIHNTCPEIEEYIKWSKPNYYYKGKGMIVTDSLKDRVTFGFWFDQYIYDSPKLSQAAKDIKPSLGFLRSMNDLPSDELLIETIKVAMENVHQDRAFAPKPKGELIIPDYFTRKLDEDSKAKEAFGKLSPSHQREYINWIVEAKTDETRLKRIEQTIEQVLEGKSKNWKYKK